MQMMVLYGSVALTAERLRRELAPLMLRTRLLVHFAGPAGLIYRRALQDMGIIPT